MVISTFMSSRADVNADHALGAMYRQAAAIASRYATAAGSVV